MKSTLVINCIYFLLIITCRSQEFVPVMNTGHSGKITGIERINGLDIIATAAFDTKVKLWSKQLESELFTYERHADLVTCIRASTDGKLMVSADASGEVHLWNILTQKLILKVEHKKRITCVDISPDNLFIAAVDESKKLILWDATTGTEVKTVRNNGALNFLTEKTFFTFLKFSTDGKFLFYNTEKNMEIYDIVAKNNVKTIKDFTGDISAITVSPDGKYLLVGTYDNLVRLYDAKSFELIKELKEFNSTITSFNYSVDQSKLLIGEVNNTISIYNSNDFVKQSTIINNSAGTLFAKISNDGKFVYCAGGESFYLFDILSSAQLVAKNAQSKTKIDDLSLGVDGKSISFSKDASITLNLEDFTFSKNKTFDTRKDPNVKAISTDGEYFVIERQGNEKRERFKINGGTLLQGDHCILFYELGRKRSTITKEFHIRDKCNLATLMPYKPLCFSIDNSRFIAQNGQKIIAYKISPSGATLLDSSNSVSGVIASSFSPVGLKFVLGNYGGSISIWDLGAYSSGYFGPKVNFNVDCKEITSVCLSNDNSQVACADLDKGITIYQATDGKQLLRIPVIYGKIIKLYFTPDGKMMVALFSDGKISTFDAIKGKELYSLNYEDENDWIFTSPDGYYYSSKQSQSRIMFRKGLELFPFDQFDLKYNRPDKVLAQTGKANPKTIELYKKAYNKRLKSMGFTEADLVVSDNLPEIKLNSEIPLTTNVESLKITLEVKDLVQVKKLFVIVNGMSILGKSGMDLSLPKSVSLTKTVDIGLKEGMNTITYYVVNGKGVSSLRKEHKINCIPQQKTKSNLYLISIGVSEYKSKAFNLMYAAKDAGDVSKTYTEHKMYDSIIVKTLLDVEVTRKGIKALGEWVKKIKPNDVVIVFIAGHGVLDKNLDYYFASNDIDFNNPALAGIPFSDLEELMQKIAAYQKMLLMDTCHSGELDKDEVTNAEKVVVANDVTFRNAGDVAIKNKIGLTEAEFALLNNASFADLRKGSGATVISSAGGAEFAMESDKWKNGLFTYCFLHGLKDMVADLDHDGKIMLSELQKYLSKEVTVLSKGKQKPSARSENLEMDFRVW